MLNRKLNGSIVPEAAFLFLRSFSLADFPAAQAVV